MPPRPTSKARKTAASIAAAEVWATAGHDLRQPLQSLGLTARILALDCTNAERKAAVENLDLVLDSLDQMAITLSNLARLVSGAQAPDLCPVDPSAIVDAVIAECASAADAVGIAIVHVSRPHKATTDPRLLAIMLRGLVLYAIKYASGDRIMLKLSRRKARTVLDIDYAGPPPGDAMHRQAFVELPPLPTRPPRLMQGIGLAFVAELAACLQIGFACGQGRDGLQRLTLQLP